MWPEGAGSGEDTASEEGAGGSEALCAADDMALLEFSRSVL